MKIHEIARYGGSNKDGVPLGLVNYMINNRLDTHEQCLCMCPDTNEVHDVLMSYETWQGTLHVTREIDYFG